MKEDLKNKIIVALGLLMVIFFISSIGAYQGLIRQKNLANQEMRTRMELEERVISLSDTNAVAQQKIKQLEGKLDQQETDYQQANQVLNQQITELKQQLETITKLKERLEQDLGEVLTAK
ncbi:MAG: hypothetical protein PVI33_01880 [Candidatus Omnitrophota bacterium]|jgi:multidrug resistance efflux pump